MKLVWKKIDERNWETQEPIFCGGFTIEREKVFNHFVLKGVDITDDGISFKKISKAKATADLLNTRLD